MSRGRRRRPVRIDRELEARLLTFVPAFFLLSPAYLIDDERR
jgi:hypothetical protein